MEKTNTLKQLLIYESASHSPYLNLAAEEYLTRTLPANTAIMFLWQNENTVVIGKNQNCYAECRVAELEACGGHLARRPSGGGAVRHDMGNLCFSFIAGEEDYNVTRQLSVISAACRAFGIDAVPSGRNDITAAGAKFSGNAFYSVGKNHCHHGTVLIDCDFSAMSRFLTVKKSKLEAKGIESVRSRVVNLSMLCPGLTVNAFSGALRRAFGKVYGITPKERELPPFELYADRAEFFASPGWIYGADPPFTDELSGRFPWGGITLRFSVENGKIISCTADSDALDVSLPADAARALVGTALSRASVLEALQGLSGGADIASLFDYLPG